MTMSKKCAVCELSDKPYSQWSKKQKYYVPSCGLLLLAVMMLGDFSKQWAKTADREQRVEQIGGQMSSLADQGKPEAIIWMAVNHPDVPERVKALEVLADTGNGEAMMALANIKRRSDPYLAKVLVNKAAAAGQPDAVLAVVRNPDTFKL
ncbi:TPA: hypothetical protein L4559_005133 [Pseudomonas aeruginosa]|nr:hypothetical protein [Pseudomonas aeruginosa]